MKGLSFLKWTLVCSRTYLSILKICIFNIKISVFLNFYCVNNIFKRTKKITWSWVLNPNLQCGVDSYAVAFRDIRHPSSAALDYDMSFSCHMTIRCFTVTWQGVGEKLIVDCGEDASLSASVEGGGLLLDVNGLCHPSLVPVGFLVKHRDTDNLSFQAFKKMKKIILNDIMPKGSSIVPFPHRGWFLC